MAFYPLITKNAAKGLLQGDPTTGAMRFSVDGGQTWKEISIDTFIGVTDISYANGIWTITYSDATTEEINVGVDNFLSNVSFDSGTSIMTFTMVDSSHIDVDMSLLVASKANKVPATEDTILTVDASGDLKATSKVFGGNTFNTTPNVSTIPSESSVDTYVTNKLNNYVTEEDMVATLSSFATDAEVASGYVAKDGSKVLSDNNYDSISKSKLDGLQNITTIGANLLLDSGTLSANVSSSGASVTWHIINSNTTAQINHGYMVDASSNDVELTLPASYTLGDTIPVCVLDKTHAITLKANGSKIQGVAEDMTVDIEDSGFHLTASDTTYGWRITTDIPVLGATRSKLPGVCNGRLTLTSNTPITTSDVISATTIYLTPYNGNQIALYDGATWGVYSFSELSLSLSGLAANTNFDVFIYNNSGIFTLESVAWSDGTTRATALIMQDGIYVKSGATTRRYLGTFRTTATIGQCENSQAKRFVWNYYNQVSTLGISYNTTANWTYATATWREHNGGTGQIRSECVVGLASIIILSNAGYHVTTSGTSIYTRFAINGDSTNAVTKLFKDGYLGATYGGDHRQVSAGYFYVTQIEYAGAGTSTGYGGVYYDGRVTLLA